MQQRGSHSPLDRPAVRALIAGLILAAIAGAFYARSVFSGDDGDRSGGPISVGSRPAGAVITPEAGLGAMDGRAPIVGQPAPDFALRDLDGAVVTLSDLRGQVVWVNFWATWCRPCKEELPDIQKLQDEMRDDGLVVLAVNKEESAEDAAAYMRDAGLSLRTLLDRSGEVYEQYRLQGLPDSFFIDREGNLASIYYGFLSEKKMRDRLAALGLE